MEASSSASGSSKADSKQNKKKQEEKKQHMRRSLEVGAPRGIPTPGEMEAKTHLLIVNGGGHAAFHGDFFALTCESPGDCYHKYPGSHRDTIKFGGDVVLSEVDVLHWRFGGGQQASDKWTYIAPPDLIDHVFAWLRVKSALTGPHRAREKDSIIMIFIGHGHWSATKGECDGIMLGGDTAPQYLFGIERFVEELRRFPRGIQVNVICNSCYSGIFAEKIKADGQDDRWILTAASSAGTSHTAPLSPSNRYRNGLFTAGLVRSLGGLQTSTEATTLKQIKDDLTEATQAHPDTERRSNPQSYFSGLDYTQKVADLLVRKFADFPMMTENSAARRRNELDLEYLQNYPDPRDPSAFAIHNALDIIIDVTAATPDPSAFSEGGFGSAAMSVQQAPQLIPDLLRGMVWRGRYQMVVFQTFMLLCCTQRCDISAMTKLIDWDIPNDESKTPWVFRALFCFEYTHALDGPPRANFQNRGLNWIEFFAPMTWLATMIARSAPNITACFDMIIWSKFLGGINWELFKSMPKLETQWEPEEDTRAVDKGTPPYFGVFLPCGIDLSLPENSYTGLQTQFCQKLMRIENAYEEYFGVPANARISHDDKQDWEKDLRDWTLLTPAHTP